MDEPEDAPLVRAARRLNFGRHFWPGTLAAVLTSGARASDYHAKVIGITDGDTITVLQGRTPVKLRLHGIDAPEAGQDFGSVAKQTASSLAFGKTVTVHPVDTDRYGRTVAEVTLPEGRSLNHEMVRLGMAWWFRSFAPADRLLECFEREARDGRRGLWSQPNPIPPWDWRDYKRLPVDLATKVIGNTSSRVFHRATCPIVAKIAAGNRVTFRSARAASTAGYRPGRDCFR